MRRWNDSEGGPKHKSQCLHVGGHVQPRNLQDQTHDKDQSHSGYVEVSERLPRKKGQLLNPVHFSTSSHSRPDTKRRSRSHWCRWQSARGRSQTDRMQGSSRRPSRSDRRRCGTPRTWPCTPGNIRWEWPPLICPGRSRSCAGKCSQSTREPKIGTIRRYGSKCWSFR